MKDIDKALDRREQLYHTLLQYTQQQERLSCSEDPAAYSGLVELKDQCLVELMKNETVLKRLLAIPENDDNRTRLDAWNRKMTPVAREIQLLDKQCRARFNAEMQGVRSKLTNLSRGKIGIAGYQAAGRFIGAAGAYTDNRS